MEKFILFLFLGIFYFNFSYAERSGSIHICPSCRIKSIQEALNLASHGDTIFLGAGIYHEANLRITKSIKIIANPKGSQPIVDIDYQGNGFLVEANSVEISGIFIRNSGFSHTEEFAGIKASKVSDCTIRDNHLENNTFGIYVVESQSCTIKNNFVKGTHKSESLSGNGIHLWNSNNMKISHNELQGNRDGIYLEFVKNSFIQKNKSSKNLRYGLHFMYSHYNEYRENTFQDNECGVAVMYSRHIQMFRNYFIHNHGPISYGILLKDISDSMVASNVFLNNTVGIFLDGTTRTLFERNQFKDNGWALRILGDTDSNQLTKNNFLSNTFDVTTNAGVNQNSFSENYWDKHKGLDLNHDGYIDDPYHPVKLSALFMENYKISIVLVHSIFFTLLDEIENALPILTPETFKDTQPSMIPIARGDL